MNLTTTRHQDNQVHLVIARQSNLVTLMTRQANPVHSLTHILMTMLAQGAGDLRDRGILVRTLQEAKNPDLQDRGILDTARMVQEVGIRLMMSPKDNLQMAQEVEAREASVPGDLRTRVPTIPKTAPEVEDRGVRT